jgi:selenocysteine-specific translation elongation factor
MTKLSLKFADFQSAVGNIGTAVQQSDSIFFYKTANAGKIELNLNSGTWTVGSGSKYLTEITAAVKAAGFTVVKENRGWTILNFVSVNQFVDLFKTVVDSVPATMTKAPKAKATKSVAKTVDKSAAEVARIKEKNLETMRAVSKKLDKTKEYQIGKVSSEKKSTEKVSKEEMMRRKAQIDSFTNYETDELPSFRSPEKLTRDEVKYMV